MRNILTLIIYFITLIVGNASLAVASTASEQFEQAWNNPAYTQIMLNDIDINRILEEHYTTDKPLVFTKTMLWDLERKKAWDPHTYIGYVVKEGKSWGKKNIGNGDEHFMRYTKQKQWLSDSYADVFEKVYVMNKIQKAIFLGVAEIVNEEGKLIKSNNSQPLFYVEHGVSGTENQPLNSWRVVHLTTQKDPNIIEFFKKFHDQPSLPGYIEIYIKKDLGIDLKKK